MKVIASTSLILLTSLIAPASLAGVQCTAEAIDLFERGNQADQDSRLDDARSLYTQAAQQCDRSNYWMAVGNIWVNDFLGGSADTVNQQGGAAIEAYGKAFEAARLDGNKIEGAAAARALVELGLRAGDPIRANDWLLLAQSLDPASPELAELQREVDFGRAELSTAEIETGLSKTRGIGVAHRVLNGTTGSANWGQDLPNRKSELAISTPGSGGGAGAVNKSDADGGAGAVASVDKARSISIPINFEYNSTQTTGQTANNIQNLAMALVSNPGQGSIVLIGHSDARGGTDYNMQLSRERANEIRKELESLQPSLAGRLSVDGRGALEPVDPGNTERAYANNRRLEVVVRN